MKTSLSSVDLEILIPAYKEAEALELLLPQIQASLEEFTGKWLVTVVDTVKPMDTTPEVCGRYAFTRYVQRRPGNSYGDAIRTGLSDSVGRYVAIMDADGSHNPAMLPHLWNAREQAEVVIASRYVRGGRTENPMILIAMSYAVNLAFRLVLGLPCRDVSNSFRLYRGDLVKGLELRCENFDIVEEILVVLMAQHPNLRILEVPSTFERRKKGASKRNLLLFIATYAATLARLWRRKRAAQKSPR